MGFSQSARGIMNFQNLQTTIKGNIGESIIEEMLIKQGYVVYKTETDAPHPYDFLAVKNKTEFKIFEVKTKARMNRRAETGINQANFKYYMEACTNHNMRLFLVFVDEKEARIYGNYLDVLEQKHTENGKTYPYIEQCKGGYVRYYPLSKMRTIKHLNPEQVRILKDNSTRRYSY